MNFIFLFLIFFLFWRIKDIGRKNSGYISIEHTQAVNGFFIILVFLRHFCQYVDLSGKFDSAFAVFDSQTGQLIVTSFMFYSGYGVAVSAERKGRDYLRSFPENRILKTMVLFDSAILLYAVLDIILGKHFSIADLLLSFIGWRSIGNSNWYIFAILSMYLITYLSFMLAVSAKPAFRKIMTLLLASVFTLAYMLVVRCFQPAQFYNTVLCYTMGIGFALYKTEIDKLLSRKGIYISCLGLSLILFIFLHIFRKHNLIFAELHFLVFVICLVLITMRVKIGNPVLQWCGKNLLGLYILQRLPMMLFGESDFISSNIYLYLLLCIAVTLLLTFLFSRFVISNINRLFRREKL